MTRVSVFALSLLLAGCHVDDIDATPSQYEQAKADCAPHAGLQRVNVALYDFQVDRIVARCGDHVVIERPVDPNGVIK